MGCRRQGVERAGCSVGSEWRGQDVEGKGNERICTCTLTPPLGFTAKTWILPTAKGPRSWKRRSWWVLSFTPRWSVAYTLNDGIHLFAHGLAFTYLFMVRYSLICSWFSIHLSVHG
jgi:hypothetical protein